MTAAQLAGALGGTAGLLAFTALVLLIASTESRRGSTGDLLARAAAVVFTAALLSGLAAIWFGALAS